MIWTEKTHIFVFGQEKPTEKLVVYRMAELVENIELLL